MSGPAVLLLAALGVAVAASLLLLLARRLFRRRPPSFQDQLRALAPRPGNSVGPAGGVAPLDRRSHDLPDRGPRWVEPQEEV